MLVIASTVDSLSFEEYAGTAPVGAGAVDDDTVFFIDEQTGALGKSWYLFYEPTQGQTFTATFTSADAVPGTTPSCKPLRQMRSASAAGSVDFQ